jgi:hypothetical protein
MMRTGSPNKGQAAVALIAHQGVNGTTAATIGTVTVTGAVTVTVAIVIVTAAAAVTPRLASGGVTTTKAVSHVHTLPKKPSWHWLRQPFQRVFL